MREFDTLILKVVGVTDGDTITGLSGTEEYTIRLHGVDAPESHQDFGSKAKEFVSAECFGKTVKAEVTNIDRYGRHVARIYLPDGSVLNEKLVEAGLAHWYEQYAPDDIMLKVRQSQAQSAKRGLWGQANPVAPWEFRQDRDAVVEPGSERNQALRVQP